MEISGQHICLKRALQLYLQQSPLETLLAEFKASAAGTEGGGARDEGLAWTSLAFQQRFAAEVVGSPVAERFPPRLEYVARLTKVLLNEVEAAGEEPAEGLLRARVACVASLREGTDRDETAFESFCVPPSPRRSAITPCGATTASLTEGGVEAWAAGGAGAAAEGLGGFDEEREAGVGVGVEAEAKPGGFLSFRVANKDNEVGLRVWEAGRALADFCVAHWRLLEGKRVVELGAGIGMTGTAVAVCCGAREVVLTDYAPRVLANLRFNVEINRRWLLQSGPARNADAARLSVRPLDWTDYASPAPPKATRAPLKTVRALPTTIRVPSPTARAPWGAAQVVPPEHPAPEGDGPSEPSPPVADVGGGERRSVRLKQGNGEKEEEGERKGGGGETDALGVPEVILAADVVYDVRYHPALVGVVVETLRRCPDALIIFASTLRNAETMGAFHRCLEEAGVPWHSVNFPGRGGLSPQQQQHQQQQSAEGTTAQEDAAAAADAPTPPRKSCASDATAVATDVPTGLPREGCASSRYSNRGGGGSYSSRGGGGTSEEASSGEVSTAGVSLEGRIPQPGISPPNGIPRAGVSQPDASQREVLLQQTNEILQPRMVGALLDTDAKRTAKEDATSRNSPPFPGERGALSGGAELASLSGGSGLGFWCHPGDLERVRFCVCGRGRGLGFC